MSNENEWDKWANETDEQNEEFIEELKPLMEQVEALCEKHGAHGYLVLQTTPTMMNPENRDEMGHGMLSRGLNLEAVKEAIDHVKKVRPSTQDEWEEVLKDHTLPGPVLMVIQAMVTGSVSGGAVLESLTAATMKNHPLFKAIHDALNQVLGGEGVTHAPPKKEKVKDSFVEVIEDGHLVGFKNIRTGEVEYFADDGMN